MLSLPGQERHGLAVKATKGVEHLPCGERLGEQRLLSLARKGSEQTSPLCMVVM